MSERVWISSLVKWLAEYRIYVVNNNIVDCIYYQGDPSIGLDMDTVIEAVNKMSENAAPNGYAMDFGVIDTGNTYPVEVNDGLGLGAYEGIAAEKYGCFVVERWRQMFE